MIQPMRRLTLVRHGETEGQSSIRYHGRTDVPLNALGRAQMERTRAALRDETFSGVYASTLSRSVQAATIVGRTTAVTQVPGFDEIDFGDWEGLTQEEIRAGHPEAYARWAANGTDFHYPGGESTRAFRERVVHALHNVLATAPAANLLFVVHKGIIRCVLGELLRLDDVRRGSWLIALGSIHVIDQADGVWRPEALDRTDHL